MKTIDEVLEEQGITTGEIIKRDEHGNMIYLKNEKGEEREFDKEGRTTHLKCPCGYEWWVEYDKKGNVIYSKSAKGLEEWSDYDKNGNETNYKNSTGFEEWFGYDKMGNQTHYKTSTGMECWKEYDEKKCVFRELYRNNKGDWFFNGKVVKKGKDEQIKRTEEYIKKLNSDDRKNMFQSLLNEGCLLLQISDQDIARKFGVSFTTVNRWKLGTNKPHSKMMEPVFSWLEDQAKTLKKPDGHETWVDYNKQGKATHFKNSDGYEWWKEFDNNGRLIHLRNLNGEEKWWEYDEGGDVAVKYLHRRQNGDWFFNGMTLESTLSNHIERTNAEHDVFMDEQSDAQLDPGLFDESLKEDLNE